MCLPCTMRVLSGQIGIVLGMSLALMCLISYWTGRSIVAAGVAPKSLVDVTGIDDVRAAEDPHKYTVVASVRSGSTNATDDTAASSLHSVPKEVVPDSVLSTTTSTKREEDDPQWQEEALPTNETQADDAALPTPEPVDNAVAPLKTRVPFAPGINCIVRACLNPNVGIPWPYGHGWSKWCKYKFE